jgi:hypothetical protein
MSKFVLNIEEEYDFSLLGISCHAKDYRLCWELNKTLHLELVRVEDYLLDKATFSFYEFQDEENYLSHYFIANRGSEGYLIPEQKKVDYWLISKGNISDSLIDDFICKINSVSLVLTSFNIDPNQLKSKQNLLF